jgi:hypothetical protein
MNNKDITNLCTKHIARVLNRLEKRFELPHDVSQCIKAQFRLLQKDLIEKLEEEKKDEISINK